MISGTPMPAKVYSYDPDKRQCRIEIEGITTNAENMPLADILYPIGDKGSHTELEILKDDLVWITFIDNDIRYPLIIGSRASDSGNSEGWRKYHHANIELSADGKILYKATEIELTADTITVNGKFTVNGDTTVNGKTGLNGDVSVKGDLSSSGTVSDSDGKNTA